MFVHAVQINFALEQMVQCLKSIRWKDYALHISLIHHIVLSTGSGLSESHGTVEWATHPATHICLIFKKNGGVQFQNKILLLLQFMQAEHQREELTFSNTPPVCQKCQVDGTACDTVVISYTHVQPILSWLSQFTQTNRHHCIYGCSQYFSSRIIPYKDYGRQLTNPLWITMIDNRIISSKDGNFSRFI